MLLAFTRVFCMHVSKQSSYNCKEIAAPSLNGRLNWNNGSKLQNLDEHTSRWTLFETRGVTTLKSLEHITGSIVVVTPRQHTKNRAQSMNMHLTDTSMEEF